MMENIYDELENLESDEDGILSPINKNDQVYPQASIKTAREQYPIFQLKRKYDNKVLILDPDFQREGVWGKKQNIEIIESVLMGLPLPNFYFDETKDGKFVVIDGRQRLSAFFSYLEDGFALENLRILPNLNGLMFSELEPKLQANLEDFQLTTQVIKPPTPDRIKFDIFDRVNRGGTVLNNQEMRNALYQGESTKLLKELSTNKMFLRSTDRSVNSKRMKDRYIILRALSFFALKQGILKDENGHPIEYRNDMDEFLGKSMECINRSNETFRKGLEDFFEKTMINNYIIFEQNAFRLFPQGKTKRPINIIMFEAFSYLFAHFSKEQCQINKDKIKEICFQFLGSEKLDQLLLYDRGRNRVILDVFDMMDVLKEEIKHVIRN